MEPSSETKSRKLSTNQERTIMSYDVCALPHSGIAIMQGKSKGPAGLRRIVADESVRSGCKVNQG